MNVKGFINPKYKNQQMISFLDHLCSDFNNKGHVIFQNKRNLIKSFTLDDGSTIVVKQYSIKGVFSACLRMFVKSKAQKAFENGITLEHFGISTPTPIAYIEQKRKYLPSKSYYISAFTNDVSIKSLLERNTPDRKMVEAFASLIAQMHIHGIVHHDLNLSNVLYHEENNIYNLTLIDINRMTFKKKGKLTLDNCKDDFMRFTGRLDVFIAVLYCYARLRGWNAECFVRKQVLKKIKHDANWTTRKKIHSFFHKIFHRCYTL
jgi:hypothetical protein